MTITILNSKEFNNIRDELIYVSSWSSLALCSDFHEGREGYYGYFENDEDVYDSQQIKIKIYICN